MVPRERLRVVFPSLFQITIDWCTPIADCIQRDGDRVVWDIFLRVEVHDWAVDKLRALMERLYIVLIIRFGLWARHDEMEPLGTRLYPYFLGLI